MIIILVITNERRKKKPLTQNAHLNPLSRHRVDLPGSVAHHEQMVVKRTLHATEPQRRQVKWRALGVWPKHRPKVFILGHKLGPKASCAREESSKMMGIFSINISNKLSLIIVLQILL